MWLSSYLLLLLEALQDAYMSPEMNIFKLTGEKILFNNRSNNLHSKKLYMQLASSGLMDDEIFIKCSIQNSSVTFLTLTFQACFWTFGVAVWTRNNCVISKLGAFILKILIKIGSEFIILSAIFAVYLKSDHFWVENNGFPRMVGSYGWVHCLCVLLCSVLLAVCLCCRSLCCSVCCCSLCCSVCCYMMQIV